MNSLTSQLPIPSNPINDLKNHDNFILDWINIFPELVEVAEDIYASLRNNPNLYNQIVDWVFDIIIVDWEKSWVSAIFYEYIIELYTKSGKKAKYIYVKDSDDYKQIITEKLYNNIWKHTMLIIWENINSKYNKWLFGWNKNIKINKKASLGKAIVHWTTNINKSYNKPKIDNNQKNQIKLLSKYIIDNYLWK